MFKKRETVLQNMTYIALMCAINVIFVLLTTILPLLFVLIIFLLPLTSVIVYLFCKKIFFPIYAVSTIGLCLIFNLWRLTDTIFYVAPSIITGLIFGICIEKRIPLFFTILISTIVQVGITYASFPLIKLLIEVDTIDYFLNIFKLSEFEYKDYLPPIFIFVISCIQILLTVLIVNEEIIKFGMEFNHKSINTLLIIIIETSLIGLSIIFIFIYGPISLLVLSIAIYVAVYQLSILLNTNKIVFVIALSSSLVVGLFSYALLNQFMNKPFSFVLFNIPLFIVNLLTFSNYCLEKVKNKDKLNKE